MLYTLDFSKQIFSHSLYSVLLYKTDPPPHTHTHITSQVQKGPVSINHHLGITQTSYSRLNIYMLPLFHGSIVLLQLPSNKHVLTFTMDKTQQTFQKYLYKWTVDIYQVNTGLILTTDGEQDNISPLGMIVNIRLNVA